MIVAVADLWIKAVGGVIAFAGAYIAAAKYLEERVKSNETARLEARRPFSTKQQEVYSELLNVTGIVSNRYGQDDWEVAFARFWVMFWGVVPLVADQEVSSAVDDFADSLDYLENGVGMRNASMDLARACRRSLGKSWSADFTPYIKSRRAIHEIVDGKTSD